MTPAATADAVAAPTEPVVLRDDGRRRGRGLSLALADQAVFSATTFGTVWLVAHGAQGDAARELGLFSVFGITVWMYARELMNGLVSTPHMVRLPSRPNARARARLNGSALAVALALTVAATVALFGVALGFELAGRTGYALLFACGAPATAGVMLQAFARLWAFAEGQPHVAAALDVGVLALHGAAALALWHRELLNAPNTLLSLGAATLASAAVALVASRRSFAFGPNRAQRDARVMFRDGRWVLASSLVWVTGSALFPVLIAALTGSEASAGAFAACYTIAGLANPILMGLQNWAGPAIARWGVDLDAHAFARRVFVAAALFAVALAPFALLLFLFGDEVLRVFGKGYAGMAATAGLVATSMLFNAVSFVVSRGLFSQGRASADFWANALPLALALPPGLWLIARYGALGAAVTLALVQLVGACARVALFARGRPA